jgi:hypothetical protein
LRCLRIADSSCVESSFPLVLGRGDFLPLIIAITSVVFALPFGPTIKPHSNPVGNPHLASSENTSVSSLFSFLFFCLPHCSSLNFYFSTYLCFATSQKALPPALSFFHLQNTSLQHVGPHVSLLSTSILPLPKAPVYLHSSRAAALPASPAKKCSDILQILEEICQ